MLITEKISMSKKNIKPIKPQYVYKNGKPIQVYLPIEDYERFMEKLQKLSKEAQLLLKPKDGR